MIIISTALRTEITHLNTFGKEKNLSSNYEEHCTRVVMLYMPIEIY
jgi:hypothetical protein